MEDRTIRDFEVASADDTWEIIGQWLKESKYFVKEAFGANRKLFQKGVGFLVAPMMLDVSIEENKVHMEAYVRTNFFIRLFALFLIPEEMGVESGGIKLMAPRKIARKAVNKLLERLGQPEIG